MEQRSDLNGRASTGRIPAEALRVTTCIEEATHVVEGSPVFDDGPGSAVPVPPELSSHPGRHCRGVDPEVFFPLSESTGLGVLQARLVCTGCPVRVVCREWATVTGQYGIWGGTTREERAAHRRAAATAGGEAARPAVAA
ncbi:WhiB family transcriptional regulator [Pseudonocardia sp. Ae707_Ps2]|nr:MULTISPECIES: WhiB family transcriptional regulator [unclassified Pseudonocardia]